MLDTVSGIFLATSPWLLGFSDKVFLPHLALGLIIIGAAIITSIKPKWHHSTNLKLRNREPLK